MDNHVDVDYASPVQTPFSNVRPTIRRNYIDQVEDANSLLSLLAHTQEVIKRITLIAGELAVRGVNHDRSKFSPEEYPSFAGQTAKLKDLVYGSEEYHTALEKIRPAVDHHYAHNRHHPKHFPEGIRGMNLIDICEMFCDWHASVLRQKDGNIRKSIEVGQKLFEFSDDLKQIFLNTIEVLEEL